MLSTVASTRNCSRMWRALAPTAMRMPISRVRSRIEIHITFIIPTAMITIATKITITDARPVSPTRAGRDLGALGNTATAYPCGPARTCQRGIRLRDILEPQAYD